MVLLQIVTKIQSELYDANQEHIKTVCSWTAEQLVFSFSEPITGHYTLWIILSLLIGLLFILSRIPTLYI